jgi:hypothetical protein
VPASVWNREKPLSSAEGSRSLRHA